MKKKYSVLLLYPDYVADHYGETFYGWVAANGPKDAVRRARIQCIEMNSLDLNDLEDLAVLLVTEGHNEGV